MGKTATLNIRVNPDVKENAERVLEQLGIPMATAIDMYLKHTKTATTVTIFFFPEKQVILTSRRINSRIMQISRRIIRTFCIAILHSTKLIIFRLSF